MTCLSEAVAEPLLSLLLVPDALIPLSAQYLRIFFLALPGILVYNFASAIFRSQGDTRTPLFCLALAGVIKVIISYTLVAFFIRAWQLWRSLRHVRHFFRPPCW